MFDKPVSGIEKPLTVPSETYRERCEGRRHDAHCSFLDHAYIFCLFTLVSPFFSLGNFHREDETVRWKKMHVFTFRQIVYDCIYIYMDMYSCIYIYIYKRVVGSYRWSERARCPNTSETDFCRHKLSPFSVAVRNKSLVTFVCFFFQLLLLFCIFSVHQLSHAQFHRAKTVFILRVRCNWNHTVKIEKFAVPDAHVDRASWECDCFQLNSTSDLSIRHSPWGVSIRQSHSELWRVDVN